MSSTLCQNQEASVFHRSGLAALSDMETPEWKKLFSVLKEEQFKFLENAALFRSEDLQCSLDPLHQWSRVWEYPYVYFHMRQLRFASESKHSTGNVVDLGSGLTFFPFSIARLGYSVKCLDIDPVCVRDVGRAVNFTECGPGSVSASLTEGSRIPLEDESVDALYCVSVLEHVTDISVTMTEISRVLKPGGLLVLTFDIAASAGSELTIHRFRGLRRVLEEQYIQVEKEVTVHPRDLLHCRTGPFPLKNLSGMRLMLFRSKQLLKPLLGSSPVDILQLYVYGGVFSRKRSR